EGQQVAAEGLFVLLGRGCVLVRLRLTGAGIRLRGGSRGIRGGSWGKSARILLVVHCPASATGLVATLLDAGCLAAQLPEVVQLGAAHPAPGDRLDLVD